ncbi:MAG: 2Fe-2S iron-sulfur cluster-binding protein [Myxococcota bacterium]
MSEVFEVVVDGQATSVPATASLLDAVREAGVYVPVLCHDPRLKPQGSCGICMVEVSRGGEWRQQAACATKVAPHLEVRTQSEHLDQSRRWTIELLFSHHSRAARFHPERVGQGKKPPLVCACQGHRTCALRSLCLEAGADPDHLGRRKLEDPPIELRSGIELEMSKCVRCDRCVRICREVASVEALSFMRRGHETTLVYARPVDAERGARCDACEASGALCIDTCPTDALHPPRGKKLKVL